MNKPREFWISIYDDQQILNVHTFETKPGVHVDPDADEIIRVREVVPMNWNKIWDKFKGTMALKDYLQIEKLVEKQLAGEE